MIRAWRTWSRDGLPESPAAWMTTVTRRELARWMDGPAGRTWRSTASEPRPDTHEGHDMLVERLAIRAALRELPAHDRLVLRLRYEHDRTHAEIARLTGVPEGTAKVRLHRARARLRAQLAS